jgi:hypothetical protein
MNNSTIEQVIGMDKGFVIPAVTGTVKVVFPQDHKEGQKGPYTIQNFILQDATGEIKVGAFDHPDLSSLKGKTVTLAAGKDGRNKFGGLEKDGYQNRSGEFVHQLKMTRIGRILDEATEAAHAATGTKQTYAPAPQAPRASHSAANQGQGTTTTTQTSPAPRGGLSTVHAFNQLANVYLHALEAAAYVRRTAQSELGVELTDEDFRACASSLFIEANKQGIGRDVAGGAWHKHVRKAEPEPVAPAPEPIKYTGPVAVADADDFGDPPF